MPVTAYLYSHFPTHLLNALTVGMGSETAFKCMLTTSSYSVSQENDDFKDDVTNEVSGTGYTAGGATLTSTTVAEAAKVTTFDAADTSWTSSTITARYAVIYDSTTGVTSTEPLVMYLDFGADKSTDNGTFQIQWHTNGIFTITVS